MGKELQSGRATEGDSVIFVIFMLKLQSGHMAFVVASSVFFMADILRKKKSTSKMLCVCVCVCTVF